MSRNIKWMPLDPDEGPTIWARPDQANSHTFHVATGEDPTDPMKEVSMSLNEVRRLAEMVEEHDDEVNG